MASALKPNRLTSEQLNTLSPPAQRLYSAVWNRLEPVSEDRVYMSRDEAERKANLRPEELETIQIELIRSGFLYIKHAERNDRYQLVPPDKQGRREHVTRIASHGKPLGNRGSARSMGQQGSGWAVRPEPVRRYSDEP
jgi:hypothetical protein